jgi:hypothetical protein
LKNGLTRENAINAHGSVPSDAAASKGSYGRGRFSDGPLELVE